MNGAAAPASRPVTVLNPALLDEAVVGLTAREKNLGPKWLYDERGSELFELITSLPEYYLTRVEAEILQRHAESLASLVPAGGALVELGSGASIKTRYLLDAGAHFGAYIPIDISSEFLRQTADGLKRRYPDLKIVSHAADFSAPLGLPGQVLTLPKIGFFPGSTIGNLDPATAQTLLRNARDWPAIEGFILGVDLVKDVGALVAAYDDAQGVTAEFIANILVRLNREVGANFDLGAFTYEATWNKTCARIDMRLLSVREQTVELPGAQIEFSAGEPIHVSSSRKYTAKSLSVMASSAGWQVAQTFTDAESRFSVVCLTPCSGPSFDTSKDYGRGKLEV